MNQEQFEPKLVGFLCNWCSYTGADLAGTARMTYAPNVRIIRVMCSGRVDPQFVLKAFHEGADGVLISGCHPGDCHYQDGNTKTLRRHRLLSRVLEQFGIEKERFRLEWVSASEGDEVPAGLQRIHGADPGPGPAEFQTATEVDLMSDAKPKVAFYWCSSCGGCEESIVDLGADILKVVAAVDIVFWPVALDFKKKDVEAMPDKSIAVILHQWRHPDVGAGRDGPSPEAEIPDRRRPRRLRPSRRDPRAGQLLEQIDRLPHGLSHDGLDGQSRRRRTPAKRSAATATT